ncbi:unnamed protein product [Prunus armeniaca]
MPMDLSSDTSNLDWPLYQFDVNNAFVRGELIDESPRTWFAQFIMAMKNNGFKQSNSYHTLFLKHHKGKNLGGLKYLLGIEVARSQQDIFLSQMKYVLDLLTDTRMLYCKPIDTHIVHNLHIGEYPDQVPTNKEIYQRLGSVTDKRSTSVYFTFMGGNLVTWKSKKQKVVALSSAEAEFRGMSKGIFELL